MNEQEKLTKRLIEASDAYYNGKTVLMSDLEFDKELETLRKMEEENGVVLPGSPTQNVGVKAVTELKKARHEQPALSLDKVKYKNREDLVKWLGDKQAVMSWKCDGNSVVLTYDGGKLTSAVTRGNGEEGSVITHNARFFKGVPTQIQCSDHIVVRGEAMMTNIEFDRVNAEAGGIYENARNLATATIQMLDADESRKREIIFKAFELVTPDAEAYSRQDSITTLDPANVDYEAAGDYDLRYMGERLNWLSHLGFSTVNWEYVDATDVLQKIEEWKENVPHLPYPTDGLVFSYNDLKEGWALGSTGHHPRWAIALKWTDETVETTIRDIEWSVGKTGLITPVAVFDEVRLGIGSNVTRASLHNISIMEKLRVKKNCKAEVYLANLIIPQIASCEGGNEDFDIPDNCPVCGAHTRLLMNMESDTDTLHCDNPECPAQQVGRLMNTFGKDGLFVKGLGESQIQDLIEYGIVDASPLSFYRATTAFSNGKEFSDKVVKLLEKDGWGKKRWENLVDAINASRNTTLQKFLYSLNIPLLGNDLSKKIAKFMDNDVDKFAAWVSLCKDSPESCFSMLTSLDGVGDEKARNIVSWAKTTASDAVKNAEFRNLISSLKFENSGEMADASLTGLTFVITGSVHEYKNRDEFKASVEARGGKVAGSVSAKTTALVNNDVESTSGKNQKAKELGIEIISEDEFISRYGK